MDELQILVKAIVDESSEQSMNTELGKLTKALRESHKIELEVALEDGSVKTVQNQLQAIAKQISTSGAGKGAKVKVFDSDQLQADGQRYFSGVKNIVSRAQAEFRKMGKVDVTNVFKDAKGNIQSFTASVTKADGIVEKFNFELAKIKEGTKTLKGFVQSNSVLSDKNAGTGLEKTLNYLNHIDSKIADITSKTLVNTSKPLLGNMEQFNQYQTKLTAVKTRIEEIKKANTTLSAEHKREIDSMVADLQRYAKELQTSAYAATDLNAATFANKKAELQAALQTDIKKWTNAGLFGGDFEAAVNKAKALLDNAMDPTDLDTYRHQLNLISQQFKQMKLDGTASGKLLDADRLNSNIQTAQLRIQNLKSTYSSFVSDPKLLSQWQALFDESQVISSQKELTNLNAKIRTFEQQLISAGKHSRSLFDELKANAVKMGTWMILGGVLAGVMRGVTGLYDAVVDLDTAMTELKKVTNETDEAYDAFLSSAADKAVEIGTSYSDFVTATSSFARLGHNMEDAAYLAEVANIYSVVGDEIGSIDDATSSIISTMKAFNIQVDDAMLIVDKFNEVGNNFAISSGGIGDAMQRSAAAMYAANNTIDESIALIVAANNVIQDPDMVGTMWKTVSMRIRGAVTELEEAGLETEYMAESTASLQKKVKALTNIDGLGGFDIMADSENFKSTYDIILGISEVWEKMSDIDQAALLELLAGKRQGNALAAAITNMKEAVDVMKTSVEAEGSALEEHERWQESIQAKQQSFQAQYEEFANTVLNSELIKGAYDAGTGLLGWLTELVETLGAFPTLLATITPFFDKMQLLKTTSSKNWLGTGTGISFAWSAGKAELENDIKLLDEYNAKIGNLGAATNDLTQRQIVWNDTIGKGSTNLKNSVRITDDASAATKAYKTANVGASTSVKAMGVASKAAAIGVQVLNTALNMLINLGIGLVINAIVAGISSLVTQAEDAREEAIEAAEAASNLSDEISDLANEHLILSKAVKTDESAKESLIAVQDELIEKLGLEKSEIKALEDEYGNLSDAIKAATVEKLQESERDLRGGVNANAEALISAAKPSGIASKGMNHIITTWGKKEKEINHKALNALVDAGYISSGSFGSGGMELWLTDMDLSTVDGIIEAHERLGEMIDIVADSAGSENEVYDALYAAYNKVTESVNNYSNSVSDLNKNLAEQYIQTGLIGRDLPSTLDEFEEFRQGIIDSAISSGEFSGNTDDITEVIDYAISQNSQLNELLTQLEEQEESAKAIQEKQSEIAKALVPKDYEDAEPGRDYFIEFTKYQAQLLDIKNKLSELSPEDLEIAYEAVFEHGASSWEEIVAAIEAYNSEEEVAIRQTNALRDSLSNLWNSEDFADTKAELIELAKTVEGITPDTVEDLAAESEILAGILETDGMNAKFLANVLQSMAEGGDGLSLITEEALKLNDALDGMVGKFDQVTEAKARYDSAMAVEEKDTAFRSYAEAFEVLNAQFEAGTTNSNAFWAAAEFLFGSEQLALWGWSDGLDAIYSAMEKNKIVFADAESAGAGFIERLYEMAEAGGLVNEKGEKLLEISKDATGAYLFDINPDNLTEIAEQLGITEEAALACLEALSMWGDIDFYDLTEVIKVIDEIGLSCETAGIKAINVERLTEQLLTLGKNEKEVHDILRALQSLDEVSLFTITGDVDTLTTSLQNLGLAADDGITITVDYEGLANLMSNLGYTYDETQDLITKLGEADNISLANANGEVKDVSDALEYIDTITFTEVTTGVDGVTEAVDGLDESSTDTVVSEIDDIAEASDNAVTKIYSVRDALDELNEKEITVYYSVKQKNGILGGIAGILGFANGTNSAPAGDALVGEEGAELVKSGDRAYLVGTGGAEIVHLNEGDQVYPADETKRMLNGSGKGIRGSIPAYAKGRVTTSGLRIEDNKEGTTGDPYEIQIDADVDIDGDTEDLENEFEETLRKMEEEINETLGNLEHDIFLLEKAGGSPEEIIAKYREMQQEAHAQANEFRELGLNEESDYIQDLQKKWYEYQDAIEDIYQQVFSDKIGDYEHDIFLLEKAGADSQEIIDIYRKMQEDTHAEAERYRALGEDENADYIQELQKQWWDYQESIEEMLHDIYKTTVEEHENTINYLESQYNALDSNRSSAAMSENLNKQLEAQRAIQRAAAEEADRLRATGLDENDEAIQECIDSWWDAESAIRDINSQIADDALSVFDDFIEYADGFELWGDLDFTKVDYLKQKIAAINRLFEEGTLSLKEYNTLLRETQLEIYNEQKEALTEIIEMTMELVRQEAEDHVDALEQQISDYKKIIELKKQALSLSNEEEDYEKEVAKRVAKIADVQAKIAQLDRDDSREANAEKQQLAQELAELQEDLADYQADYAYNAQVDALDKEAETFEDTKNKEIAKVEAAVDTEEEVYNAAIARIDSNWEQLYADLIAWNKQYGDMIDGEDSITSAWQTAKAAAEEYGSVVAALNGISSSAAYEEEQLRNQQYTEQAVHKIIKEMYANSQAHHTADASGKERLDKRNLELGAMLAQYGITAVRGGDGVWYIDRIGGEKLYDKYKQYTYHTGGIVGEEPNLKHNEVLAKLEKGEVVLTQKEFNGLFEKVKSGIRGIIDSLVGGLTVSEPAVSEVVKTITNNNGDTDNSITEEGIQIHNEFHMENVTEENMKQFADYYAEHTIGKLNAAAKRKGMKNTWGNRIL